MNKLRREGVINKICAMLIVFLMTMSDFLFVGSALVSYAIDMVTTNNNNVEFMAYFQNSDGEKSDIKNLEVGNTTNLYIDVTVKNEGYFNGKISLKDSNFKINKEVSATGYVSSVSENEVYLNQINAGTTITIALEIENISNNIIDKSVLSKETTLNLEGNYVNSKNVENEKYVAIKGSSKVNLNLVVNEKTKCELNANIITNGIFEVNGENKNLLQLEISSKLTNNNYPIKNTTIEVDVPSEVENINVKARSISATNKNTNFGDENYTYNEKEGKLVINIENKNEKQINWEKDSEDVIIVTYIFKQEIAPKDIEIRSILQTYDNNQKQAQRQVHIEEKIDGIITSSIKTDEEEIYKGKIYTGEEREYKENIKINVNYLDLAETIKLEAQKTVFLVEGNEVEANTVYKHIYVGKEELIKILGNEGYINIKSGNTVIASLNSTSNSDEKGNINVNLENMPSTLTIETSKPVSVGTINLKITKAIEKNELSREKINTLEKMQEKIEISYNEKNTTKQETTINLLNTISKANLNVSTNRLSTTDLNKDIKINVILDNNEESKDLYKNPRIKITLPQQVIDVSAKCKLLYGNGLELSDAKIETENGRKVIKIDLSGEQTSYNTENLEGTTLIIYASLEVDKLAVNSNEEIRLDYTNEKATSYENQGEEIVKINVESKTGVITINSLKEYSVQTIGNQGIKDIPLEIGKKEKEVTANIGIINNEGTKIKDVKILGKFPTGNNETLGASLKTLINLENNAKVYYTNNENADANLQNSQNGWSEVADTNSTTKYLIIIDSLEAGESFYADYKIGIPANLTYNMNAEEGYSVSYINAVTDVNKQEDATTLRLSTGAGAEIRSTLKAYVGGMEIKDSDKLYSGEIIRYELNLANIGTEVANNVNVTIEKPENATFVKYVKNTEPKVEEDKNRLITMDYYQVIDNATINKTIEKIEANDSVTIVYEVKITENAINNKVVSKVTVSYIGNKNDGNLLTNKLESKINNVDKSNISMEMFMTSRDIKLFAGNYYSYILKVTNNTEKKMSNIKIKINSNDQITVSNIYDMDNNEIELKDNMFNLENIKGGETVELFVVCLTSNVNGKIVMSAIANDTYISNEVKDEFSLMRYSAILSSENDGATVNNGENIIYNISVQNEGEAKLNYLDVKQKISSYLDVDSVLVNGKSINFEKEFVEEESQQKSEEINEDNRMRESDYYWIGFSIDEEINANEKLDITVKTKSDENLVHDNQIHMVSMAKVLSNGIEFETNELNHILLANTEQPSKDIEVPDDPSIDPGTTDPSVTPGQSTNKMNTISGVAWLDENQNGKHDSGERLLGGIKVSLLNLDNNETTETTTSENGFYSLTEVENGKYIVIFNYDTEKYILTTYQADSVEASRNSDVENVTVTLNGEQKKVAATDTLTVNDNNLTNIDLGLVEAKIFDLELSKTIDKVMISNSTGTQTVEYNSADLAKVEIKSKYLSGSTVVIEYTIKVTNNGEVAGYAKNIVDYKPTDLNFNSSLNKDWYQSGDYVYSTSLANTKIEPNETKELKLILTKTMTESNTGLVNNTAEIFEDYNSLGIEDKDSKVANKQAKEDDMGSANLIIGVSTGAAVRYIALTLSIIIIIGIGAYMFSKKILKDNIEF